MNAMTDYFVRLFAYDNWANVRTYKALASNNVQEGERLLAHILGASRVWQARLQNRTATNAIFPDWDLVQCGREIETVSQNWAAFLASGSQELFESTVHYRNSQGEQQGSVTDILTHVANHGTHHRAQISRMLRQSGAEPPVLDFIVFSRQSA
jgi:uncharacterized damage-inducible protein DinB